MKLGSANKWIELLRETPVERFNDGWGLRWMVVNEKEGCLERFSPVGILEDFITKTWKPSPHTGAYANKDGNVLIASKECLDKCKCKTNLEVIDDLWAAVGYNREMLCFLIGYNQETL